MNVETVYVMLAAMGDRSRLSILHALRQGDRCVEDLATALGLSASTVSFHMKKLEEAGLVGKTRDQYYSVFSINRDALRFTLLELLDLAHPVVESPEKRDEKERAAVLRAFMRDGTLPRMPAQRKKRLVILDEIVKTFDPGVRYPESEVDDALTRFNPDYCNLRRLLVDEGFMGRERGVYWRVPPDPAVVMRPGSQDDLGPLPPTPISMRTGSPDVARDDPAPSRPQPARGEGGALRPVRAGKRAERGAVPSPVATSKEKPSMDRRRELIRAYKETPIPAGVFQIRNRENGKVYLAGTMNLRAAFNANRFQLAFGKHRCEPLQKDWLQYGADAFEFSILEEIKLPEGQTSADRDDVTDLEKKWLKKLSPFGDRGYH